jgi:copper chaperone CopZ
MASTAMETLTLKIDGMHCEACIRRLTQRLSALRGVQVESVSIGEARLHFDPELAARGSIEAAISEIGFEIETHDV